MLTAAYVGNGTIELQTARALPPSRGQVASPLIFGHEMSFDDPSWLDEWTGGAGADVVFEVSGAAAA